MAVIAALRVLAHQGGWDEILMVLAPLVAFAGLLALARRRVGELEAGDEVAAEDPADREHTGPT